MKLRPGGSSVRSLVRSFVRSRFGFFGSSESIVSLGFASLFLNFFAGAFRSTSNVCLHCWEPVDQNRNRLRPQLDQEMTPSFRSKFPILEPLFSESMAACLAIALCHQINFAKSCCDNSGRFIYGRRGFAVLNNLI